MNKKSILWILLDLVFLAVFNTVFFVAGGKDHVASVWISYGFIHFAYLMVIATPLLIRKSSSSSIFGFSVYSVSSTYFLVEFITGLIFIFVKDESYKASLIVQIIIAGIYAIILISHLLANESTADSIEQHEEEVVYIKQAASEVKLLIDKSDNKRVNKEIEKVYDALHSSPTKSNFSVKIIEQTILGKIDELKNAVKNGDENLIISKTKELLSQIDERNSRLRNS